MKIEMSVAIRLPSKDLVEQCLNSSDKRINEVFKRNYPMWTSEGFTIPANLEKIQDVGYIKSHIRTMDVVPTIIIAPPAPMGARIVINDIPFVCYGLCAICEQSIGKAVYDKDMGFVRYEDSDIYEAINIWYEDFIEGKEISLQEEDER